MNIAEMHVYFRQYAQQMGMQNVRAILPEQIDVLINTSISDTVNQILQENVGVTNDRVITDNSKIGQINALRTLYKVATIDMSPPVSYLKETRTFSFSAADRMTGKMTTEFDKVSDTNNLPNFMYLVDFALNYKAVKDNLGYTGDTFVNIKDTYSILTPDAVLNNYIDYYDYLKDIPNTDSIQVETYDHSESEPVIIYHNFVLGFIGNNRALVCVDEGYENYYLGVDVAVPNIYSIVTAFSSNVIYNPLVVNVDRNYGYIQPTFDKDGVETNYFPVRLIDDAYLADTLNDFVLKNRLRSPILTIYNDNTFDLYIDKFEQKSVGNGVRYVLQNGLIPYKFRMSYIAAPAKVKYSEDINGVNVDCDLPEYLHVEIVKHAVDLYNMAITGSLQSAQAQQQRQQREAMRNNAPNQQDNQQS